MATQGPKQSPKTVQITVNANGTCSPDQAHVQKNDKIIWVGASAEMEFPTNNPFGHPPGKKYKQKEHYTVNNKPASYKYNVITPNGSYDPDVVVDPPPNPNP
jgi:hypothetical protein